MTHLFFVTSTAEAKESIYRINRLPQTDSFSIISNNPLVNLFFTNNRHPYRDSGDFFPLGKKLRTHQLKIINIAKQWAKSAAITQQLKYRHHQLDTIIGFSLFIYLAEVEHSLLTAQNILKAVNPDVVHVSRRFSESPSRRYQTEDLNLENLALEGLSRLNHMKLNLLSQKIDISTPIKISLQIASRFVGPLLSTGRPTPKAALPPLVILANYYQLANLFPFLSKLKANNLEFTAIGKINPDQLELLKKSDIPFFPVKSTDNVSSSLQAVRYFYLWHRLKPKIKRIFNSYHPLYWDLIKEKLKYLFTIEFPQITGYLDEAEKLFSQKPKILLTMATNDTFSRCFVVGSKRFGTKIIELQHGLVIFDEEAQFRKNDIHAVWGKPVVKIMNQGGRDHRSFAVTGFPYFDKYRNIKTLKYKNIKTPTVLILAAFPVAADRLIAKTSPYQFLEIVLNAVKSQHEDWKIVFRPHPSYNAAWVKEIANKLSVNLIFDQRETPLDQAISSCDLVVSNFTTAMVDVMFIGKPIFLYSFADTQTIKLASHPLITSGATHPFSSSQQLISLLDKINNQRFINKMLAGQKEFLKQYCSIDKKTSAAKLADLIKKMLK